MEFSPYVNGDTSAFFRVAVSPTDLLIETGHTDNRTQWFADRCSVILGEFRKCFSPLMVMGTSVRVNGTLAINGDARIFLTSHVTDIDKRRFRVFERPVQLFGLRLAMPAYPRPLPLKEGQETPDIEVIDSHIEAKAESLLTDPSKLFLETAILWQRPIPWDDNAINVLTERIEETSCFLREKLIKSVTSIPENGE